MFGPSIVVSFSVTLYYCVTVVTVLPVCIPPGVSLVEGFEQLLHNVSRTL